GVVVDRMESTRSCAASSPATLRSMSVSGDPLLVISEPPSDRALLPRPGEILRRVLEGFVALVSKIAGREESEPSRTIDAFPVRPSSFSRLPPPKPRRPRFRSCHLRPPTGGGTRRGARESKCPG